MALGAFLVSMLTQCSDYNKMLKSGNLEEKLSYAEAKNQVSSPPVSDSRLRKGNGGWIYIHCRQHGIWPKEVTGWDRRLSRRSFTHTWPCET